jgi:hypothetical protein
VIWLTWRQMRSSAAAAAAALAALAAVLVLTGPGLADRYDAAAGCAVGGDGGGAGCAGVVRRFFEAHQTPFLGATALVLVVPALAGLFWGAPLVAREFEAGTHRLVWNQSMTRTRWLVVKLGLVGLAAMVTAGLASVAVTWWASPIDAAAADSFPRMEPVLFASRGVVPVAYAAFAFALGVAVGTLVRRTLPAIGIGLAVFVAVQVALPLLVRPHLQAPVHSTFEISESLADDVGLRQDGRLHIGSIALPDAGAWVLSSRTVDAAGHTVDTIPVDTSSGACAPAPGRGLAACFTQVNRDGYRMEATYHPSSRFWRFQWLEAGMYAGLALGLAGFSLWWLGRRAS